MDFLAIKRALYGYPLRTWALVTAWFYFVISIIFIIFIPTFYGLHESFAFANIPVFVSNHGLIILILAKIFFKVLALFGVHKENPNLIAPIICFAAAGLILSFTVIVYYGILHGEILHPFESIILNVIEVVVIYILYKYYKELRANKSSKNINDETSKTEDC